MVTGARSQKTPKMSAWWEDYIEDRQPNNLHWRGCEQFRQRSWLLYASFVKFLDMILSDDSNGLFDRWTKTRETKKKNKEVSPIKLFLSFRISLLPGKRVDIRWPHAWCDVYQSWHPLQVLSSICQVRSSSALSHVCVSATFGRQGVERLQDRVCYCWFSRLHW